MKKFIYILSIIGFILTFNACVDPYTGNSSLIIDATTLPAASYMEQTDSLNVSMWVDLLKYTDLYNALNLADDYTCFVPNNEAVKSYLSKKGVQSVNQLNIDDAKLLVKYHIIKGALYNSVSFEEGVIPDTTATGDYLTTNFLVGGGKVQINLEATINKTIQATNAYIHVISSVLTPVSETIWDKISTDKYSIFGKAVESIGLKDQLNTVTERINDVNYKYHYTLFAVPDSVYNAVGISSFASLVDSLKAETDYTSSENTLNQYVNYHILNQQVSYSSLSYFDINDSKRAKNYNTLAYNQLINISEHDKEILINYNSTSKTGIQLISINQNCKNGVMHVVNNLMEVITPKPTTVKWELTDYAELASTESKYRTAGLTSTFTHRLSAEVATCYKWLSVPESNPGLYYVIANKNDAVAYKALNYDYLRLELGTYGWVEMTTPTIVAGKYNVTIEHYNPSGTEIQGKIWLIIDGEYFGGLIATRGASKTTNQFIKKAIGSITFNKTAKHTVRILAADNFTSDLDCLTFTP